MFLIQITTTDGKPAILEARDRDEALLRAHEALKNGVRISFEDGGCWFIPAHGIAHIRSIPKPTPAPIEAPADDREVSKSKPVRKKSVSKRASSKA